jgi:hypothetical protein
MDSRDRAEMEQIMARDAAMREEVNKVQAADAYFRTLMPLVEQPDEVLEDQLLQEWEADRMTMHQARAAVRRHARLSDMWDRMKEWFVLPAPARLALVTVTCLLLMMVGVYNYSSPDLGMMAPELLPAVSRSGELIGMYEREELMDYAMRLNEVMMRQYDALDPGSKPKSVFRRVHDWTLRSSFQELDDGMIRVDVAALSRADGPPFRQWRQTFASVDDYFGRVDMFGAGIAEDLASMSHLNR